MQARELNFCLNGRAAEVVAGLIVQCSRESREFPENTELVSAPLQQYQVGGQEAKAFLAHSCPTKTTLNKSGRGCCLAKDQANALCLALKVQFKPIET